MLGEKTVGKALLNLQVENRKGHQIKQVWKAP